MIIHSNLDFELAKYQAVPLEQEKSVFFEDKTIGWKQKLDITELDDVGFDFIIVFFIFFNFIDLMRSERSPTW